MPEITIKYEDPKTLTILKSLSKYFNFVIYKPKINKAETSSAKRSTILPGDRSIDFSELNELFTGKNINAKELRKKAWKRQK